MAGRGKVTHTVPCEEPTCRRPFQAERRNARFCSDKCRLRSSRRGTRGKMSRPRAAPGLRSAPPAEPVPGDPAIRRRVLLLRLGGADYDAIARAIPEITDAE